MAQQHIYTSASKLLDAGRSGFGTVARSKSLSPLLVSAIERVSQFANIRGTDRTRVIFVHRRITAANNRVHILTRIADAGADYTGRTNHIAHHLIVTQEEMTRAAAQGITPADVLMQFPWLERWDGAARFFGPEEDVSLIQLIQPRGLHSSRATWAHTTGNLSHARLLSWEGAPRNGVLIVPRGVDPLGILAEALAEFGTQSWSRTFTTSLESTDEMSDLDWVISSPDTFHEIEGRCGARTRFDLANPQSLPVPPEPAKVVEAPAAQLPELSPQPVPTPHIQTVANPTPRVEPLILQKSSGVRVAGRPQVKVAPVKKNNSSVLGIAAGLVGMLLILGLFYVISNPKKSSADSANNSSTDSKNETTSSVPDKKEKDDAIKKLTDKGLSPELAQKFIEQTNSDLDAWTNYACILIEFFNKPIEPTNIGDLPVPPNGNPSVGWLTELEKAKDKLFEYKSNIADDSKFIESIGKVTEINKHLKAKDLKSIDKSLSNEVSDNFCRPLIKHALFQFSKTKEYKKPAGNLNSYTNLIKNNFNSDKNPYAYEELKILIRENFETSMQSPLKKAILEGKDLGIPEDDIKQLSAASQMWEDKSKEITDDLKVGEGFIPADFKNLLANHRTKNQGAPRDNTKETPLANDTVKSPAKLSGPDLTDVKEKEIIIVSAEDLKNGVEVSLLKKLFTAETKQFPSDLQIKVDEIVVSGLSLMPDGFFGDKFNNPEYKITLNGQISILTESRTIEISFKKDKIIYHTYIVTDEKSEDSKPIFDDLELVFSDKNLDHATIGGDLAKWIESVRLKIIPAPVGKYENGKVTIEKAKPKINNQPDIIISKNRLNSIESALEEYKNIGVKLKEANSGSDDHKNLTDQLKAKNTYLFEQICIGIGEAKLLEKHPDLGGEITKNNLQKAIDKTRETTGMGGLGPTPYKSQSDFKNDKNAFEKHMKSTDISNINHVLKVYGKHYVENNDILKNLGKIDNGEDGFRKANSPSLESLVQKLVSSQNKVDNTTPQVNPLDKITSITVSTAEGRILFKAVKKP